jgi:hypothetical protein
VGSSRGSVKITETTKDSEMIIRRVEAVEGKVWCLFVKGGRRARMFRR